MTDFSYVRTEMIGEKDPPSGETGIIHWARVNLFSSITNAVLTILAVVFLYLFLRGILPWMIQSSWTATSLRGCTEAIALTYGEGTSGACWAVIAERYNQLLFGFYPKALYWRPILAFILLCAAIAPVLFDKLPRKMLIFSALFPFIGFWLVWGGSIWFPISIILGFVIGYYASALLPAIIGSLGATIAAFILPILWWMFIAGSFASAINGIIPIGLESIDSDQIGGFALSILIGITGIAFSLPIGILLALGRQSNLFVVKTI